ncbi:TPA: phage tail protein [Escherichia coli]|nr:phage tail protein [Escherichia coli]
MATKYYAVLTNVGAAKLANATALGAQVEITQMAVGDGNGVLPTPNPAQTALVHELRRKPLNSLSIDPNNANQIIAEQVIPEDEGGWWIREIGLFDKDGDMIAVANCAETYKPQLQEGSGRVQVVRMILIVSSTAAVTLKIDPSVVLATRQYVDDQIIQVKSYVDQKMAAHVAAADPHKQYAPKESPALTGRPTAPTAEGKDSSTQIANTAFVQAAIAALVGSSPEALDTLNELAAALGNDPNFATTVTNSLAGKMDKSANGSDIENVSVFLQNLGLGEGAPAIGVPFFWPSAAMPNTVIDSWSSMVFLKFNGAKFSATDYPVLAKVFPSLVLPEARGDFIRIWDDGRGADGGRELLSWQAATNFSQFAGNIGEGAGHAINFHDGIAGNQPGFSRFNFTSNSVGDGVNFVAVRPRNIAFNFLVRAK